MKLNPTKLAKLNDYTVLLLVAGILALINYLFTVVPLRLDLTDQKNYSLSQPTKTALRDLDDVVTIKVFLSKDLPSRLQVPAGELKETLKEYESLSSGKVRVKYIDPGEDIQLLQEAQSLGIPKLQFSNIEGEQFQLSQGFFGMAILYGDKTESIPMVDVSANFEYEFLSRLIKLTRDQPIKVAFTTGHEEDSTLENLQVASSILGQEYELDVQPVSTESGKMLDNTYNLLIIAGPKQSFSEGDSFLLDQYIMGGGSVLIMSAANLIDSTLQATDYDLGLNEWLSHFGITVNNNVVLDSSNEIASFNTGVTSFFVPYPYWVKVLPENISDHPAVSGLESLVLPWSSSLAIKEEETKPKVLFTTTNQAWLQLPPYEFDPTQVYNVVESDLIQSDLAALVEGELTSGFADKEKPIETEYKPNTDKGKLAVVGSSQFINDDFLRQYRTNAVFFMNLVGYLASDVDLSTIRSKGDVIRPLKPVSEVQKSIIKYGNIFGVSAGLCFLALYYFVNRNNNHKPDNDKQSN